MGALDLGDVVVHVFHKDERISTIWSVFGAMRSESVSSRQVFCGQKRKDENGRAPDALKPIDTRVIVTYNKIQIFDKCLTG